MIRLERLSAAWRLCSMGLEDVEPVTPAGSAFATPVADLSAFFTESSTPLGSSATFTGPLRDCASHNWVGAKAGVTLAAAAGTLDVDESATAAGASGIYQVATQPTAASAAAHGAPASFTGAEARVVPSKTVLRYIRIVYVNGATAQTTMDLQSALSPLN